jgi:psiF repeat
MKNVFRIVCAAVLVTAFAIGNASAQTAPATAPAAKAPKGEFKLKTPTTAISKQCSAEADAKGLHGKERQKFRNACKKAAAKKA